MYPELNVRADNEPATAFRDAVIKVLKERFSVRAVAQPPPRYGTASAGGEKVRSLVIATRELHGVVMDPEHVVQGWSDHFPHCEKRR